MVRKFFENAQMLSQKNFRKIQTVKEGGEMGTICRTYTPPFLSAWLVPPPSRQKKHAFFRPEKERGNKWKV
jgi:hypothetical protein